MGGALPGGADGTGGAASGHTCAVWMAPAVIASKIDVDPTLVFDYPTLTHIAEFISDATRPELVPA